MGLRTRSTLAASGAGVGATTCVVLCAVIRFATIAAFLMHPCTRTPGMDIEPLVS